MPEDAPKKDVKKAPAKKAPTKVEKTKAPAQKKAAPKGDEAGNESAPQAKSPTPKPKVAAPKKDKPKQATEKVNVYSLEGKIEKTISLPGVFNTAYRPDIIRRAVNSSRANRRQPYGPAPRAGMRHVVSWPGKGRGMARTPRLQHGGGKGAEVPNTPGGRRAHPPRPEKDWTEKINKKEKSIALSSAIAAVGRFDIVKARGHRVSDDMTLPIVVSDDFEVLFDTIAKDYDKDNKRPAYTKETVKILEALGLSDEMDRAKGGVHQRAGRGKSRGRKYKSPKSILFVVSDAGNAMRCLRNLPGIDVISPSRLNVELLAPGGDPGRLTVFTEKALASLGGE